jgi:hypothetical protein
MCILKLREVTWLTQRYTDSAGFALEHQLQWLKNKEFSSLTCACFYGSQGLPNIYLVPKPLAILALM